MADLTERQESTPAQNPLDTDYVADINQQERIERVARHGENIVEPEPESSDVKPTDEVSPGTVRALEITSKVKPLFALSPNSPPMVL